MIEGCGMGMNQMGSGMGMYQIFTKYKSFQRQLRQDIAQIEPQATIKDMAENTIDTHSDSDDEVVCLDPSDEDIRILGAVVNREFERGKMLIDVNGINGMNEMGMNQMGGGFGNESNGRGF